MNHAHEQLGLPYQWGGDGMHEGGFDCSGLTRAAYQAAGITIPAPSKPNTTPAPAFPPEPHFYPATSSSTATVPGASAMSASPSHPPT